VGVSLAFEFDDFRIAFNFGGFRCLGTPDFFEYDLCGGVCLHEFSE